MNNPIIKIRKEQTHTTQSYHLGYNNPDLTTLEIPNTRIIKFRFKLTINAIENQ